MEWWVQPAAVGIVVLYVLMQAQREESPRRFLGRLLLVAVAAFLAEESCIRLYSFYDYSDDWWVKVGHVPVLVLLIWPVVIHSATGLARQLLTTPARPALSISKAALAAGALVLADAALIEPVAVHAGLWHWNEPGLFAVPPIGILGWACFAAICAATFACTEGRRRLSWDLVVLPAACAGTHLLLLACWWGLLRWVNAPVPGFLAALVAFGLATGISIYLLKSQIGRRVCRQDLLLRIPAALFFGSLLLAHWPGPGALLAYFVVFTPPNIVLTMQSNSLRDLTKENPHD